MIQSLPSGSRQYVSNHLTTDTLPTFAGATLADGTACKYFSQFPMIASARSSGIRQSARLYRYEEIDLFARDGIKKVRYVSSYNTTGLNGGDETAETHRLSLLLTVSILGGLRSDTRR